MTKTTVNLDIPRTAAERLAVQSAWKCAGFGALSLDRIRSCACPTDCLYRMDGQKMLHEIKIAEAADTTMSPEVDLFYLEQAEAHADEGPLGEPAARSILAIALRYVRTLIAPADREEGR